jgi:hypothetical protein
MTEDQVKKEMPAAETEVIVQNHFLLCARMCEFKKCCKKYKHGDRCKKCPKRKHD